MLAFTLILLSPLGAANASPEPPADRELFAREDWYRGQKGKEEIFEGVLKRQERSKGAAGFGRFNPYQLVMKSGTREVYVGTQGRLLEPYLGKTVRLTGKAVDMEVEGTEHREVWPARLQVVKGEDAGRKAKGRDVPIRAQGSWSWMPLSRPVSLPRQIRQLVFRSRADVERVAGKNSLTLLAARLQVKDIDFKKEMLLAVGDGTQPQVGVSGGGPPSAPYRVHITRIECDDKGQQMTVHWRRMPRGPQEVLSYPLEMVLVRRFEGVVRFERGPDLRDVAAAPKGQAGDGVKVLARGFWPDGQISAAPSRQWVVRRYEDLVDPRIAANEEVLEKMRQTEARKYAQALGVPAIDFTRHMVVGVSAGVQRTGGFRVVIHRIECAGEQDAITVSWKLQPPAGNPPPPEGPSHPAAVALVDQMAGAARFDPPARTDQEEQHSRPPRPGRLDGK